MATPRHSILILVGLLVVVYSSTEAIGSGRMVGGRTKVKDVKANDEIQELGRFSVEQYNRHRQQNGGDLRFEEVVEAETQVVSGIKYYLRIAATTGSGVSKTFDAVVVVKAWADSKELLNFGPHHQQPLSVIESVV